MTVVVKIGRRVPKSLRSRFVSKIQGLITFQENIWIMMKMSFDTARRKWKKNPSQGKGKIEIFDVDKLKPESEDEFYNLQWLVITIKGDEEAELEEFSEIEMMRDSTVKAVLGKMKGIKTDQKDSNVLKGLFKTKVVNEEDLKEAYEEGIKQNKEKSIANILLEMGIMMHMEIINDYADRIPTPDF